MPAIVVDTNVLIAAALNGRGVPMRVLVRIERHHELAFTARSMAELRETIARPQFARHISNRERRRFLHRVYSVAVMHRVEGQISISRDPDDDVFLQIAIAADAAAIVTGDRDLLVLGEFAGIPILSPSRFLRGERSIRRGRQTRGG
jgi:putative PIN family toxin of toxin-antitoxin system